MVTLNEAKNYLRVDYEEDDALIRQLLQTAKNLVKDVGRMDEKKWTIVNKVDRRREKNQKSSSN